MLDSTTTHARMTHHSFGGSASSGSPMQPAWTSPCVLAHLGLPRPRAHAAMEPTICRSLMQVPERALVIGGEPGYGLRRRRLERLVDVVRGGVRGPERGG